MHLCVVLGAKQLHRMVLGRADDRQQHDVGSGTGRRVDEVRVAVTID